jgi:hypothetical protein
LVNKRDVYCLFGVPVVSEIPLPLPATGSTCDWDIEKSTGLVSVDLGPVDITGDVIWEAQPPANFACFRQDSAVVLSWPAARFNVTADRIIVDADDIDVAVILLLQAVWSVLLSTRRREALHACTVERRGKALAIFGASGSGKTTAGLALLDRGWNLVADDLLTFDDNGNVQSGPPFIRLTSDRSVGRAGMVDAVGKLRYSAPMSPRPVPLGAIVVHMDDATSLSRATGSEAVNTMLAQVYNDAVPFPGQAQRRFDLILDLVERVPIYRAVPRSLTAERLEQIAEWIEQ